MIPPLVRHAVACKASYLDGDARTNLLAANGWAEVGCWDIQDLRLLVVQDDKALLLVPRGTDNYRNALRDADLCMTRMAWTTPGGTRPLVHRGALEAYLLLKTRMLAALTDPARAGRAAKLAGHSLGGMIATPAAVDLPGIAEVWTYGSPRFGLPAFCAGYDATVARTVRVVHDADVIPTVPGWPYQHVAGLLPLTADGTPAPTMTATPITTPMANQALTDMDGQAEADHHIDTYIAACALYTQGTPCAS